VARDGSVPAASGIHLDVRAGRALAITGPNGAGKSTLALTLAGLLAPATPGPDAAPVRRSADAVVGPGPDAGHPLATSATLDPADPTTGSPGPTTGRVPDARPLMATAELVGAL